MNPNASNSEDDQSQCASPIAERLREAREWLAQEEQRKKNMPPKTLYDPEVWAVRNLKGRILLSAAELKPQFRHLGDPGCFRIDYRLDEPLRRQMVERAAHSMAVYPGASGVKVFEPSGCDESIFDRMMEFDFTEDDQEQESYEKWYALTVEGQFKPGMPPVRITMNNMWYSICVRIRTDTNLPIEQEKIDAFLEEVLDTAVLPQE